MLLDCEKCVPTRLISYQNVTPLALSLMLWKILGENTEIFHYIVFSSHETKSQVRYTDPTTSVVLRYLSVC